MPQSNAPALEGKSSLCNWCDFGRGCDQCLGTGNLQARERFVAEIWEAHQKHRAVRLALKLNAKCWAGYPYIRIDSETIARLCVHAVLSKTDEKALASRGFVRNGTRWEYVFPDAKLSDAARAELRAAVHAEAPWL